MRRPRQEDRQSMLCAPHRPWRPLGAELQSGLGHGENVPEAASPPIGQNTSTEGKAGSPEMQSRRYTASPTSPVHKE